MEELGRRDAATAVTVISVTVLLSVIAHGATAEPLARRYATWLGRGHGPAQVSRSELPPRRLTRRRAGSGTC